MSTTCTHARAVACTSIWNSPAVFQLINSTGQMLYGMSQLRHGIGRGNLEECRMLRKILTNKLHAVNIGLHTYLQMVAWMQAVLQKPFSDSDT
ncbi:unnamed protein product [Onchocerca flexuosa]|uniref:Acyl-CoA_dh_1 domain-containing protein n=1 Tax=Onchocerca flexuosa TaxID=387005 RepID=A0A183H5U5_9BILA|nr:unnamed protein product [Onchocerca flexuosa]